uniref:Hybrid signal transduction histidine kinase M n=1 Tax=Tanacetum cinerariifolium TaxID=118510 RepID=A0A699GJQ4_TANCI|nr:hybrid signal transduction histidine kinase M [Tanacetum cinerariifolium]
MTQKDSTVCDDASGLEVGKRRCLVYYDSSNKKSQWLMHEDTTIDRKIFTTLAKPLYSRLVDENPQTDKEAYDLLAHVFQDNKRTFSLALKAGLQYLKLGDLSIDTYFWKIEYTASILKGLRSPLCDKDVVNIALEGLPPGYDNAFGIIVHQEPFPDLKMLCFMLTTENMRLRSWAQDTFIDSTSVSPLVLLANTGTNTRRPPPSREKLHKPCFNFNKGACRFGEYCKFFHNGLHGSPSRCTKTSTENPNDDMQTLKNLMAKLGFNASVLSCGTSTVETSNGNIVPMAFDMTPPLYSLAAQLFMVILNRPNQSITNRSNRCTILRPNKTISRSSKLFNRPSSGSLPGQQMIISSTFNVVTLYDLALVGNDNSMPVTNSGYGMLPT